MKRTALLLIIMTSPFFVYAGGNQAHEHGDMKNQSTEHEGHMMHEQASEGSHHHDGGDDHATSPVGQPAESVEATKTINVNLVDSMKFEFDKELEVKEGDVVRFVVMNKGKIPHEFSIGTSEEQDAHRKMMRDMPHMKHEDGNTITVQPGETKELTWKFAMHPSVMFACNIPGHFEAGMHHSTTIQGAN